MAGDDWLRHNLVLILSTVGVPLACLLASSAAILSVCGWKWYQRQKRGRRRDGGEYRPLFTGENDLGTAQTENQSSNCKDSRHARLSIQEVDGDEVDIFAYENIAEQVEIIESRPRCGMVCSLLESLAVISLTIVSVADFVLVKRTYPLYFIMPLFWAHLTVSALYSLFFSGRFSTLLWYQRTVNYFIFVPCQLISCKLTFMKSISGQPRSLALAMLLLHCFLLVVVLCCRSGNKTVILAKTGNLESSGEPLASLASTLTYTWVDPLIWKGWYNTLEIDDVWDVELSDQASVILHTYRRYKPSASLIRRLLGYFLLDLILQNVWTAAYAILTFASPLLLQQILRYLEQPTPERREFAWLSVAGMGIIAIIVSIINGRHLWIGRRIALRLRAIIIGEVYSKALRRKEMAPTSIENDLKENSDWTCAMDVGNEQLSAAQVNNGAVINLMAVDALKISELCAYLHYVLTNVPLQILLALILLYRVLGWSAIAGILTMILLSPVQYIVASKFNIVTDELMSAADARVTKLNELLQNVRIVKFFAWEDMFIDSISKARQVELKLLKRRLWLWAEYSVLWYGAPSVITLLTFSFHTKVLHRTLSSSSAFTALALFNLLQGPLDQFADMVTNILQARVSLRRVADFLNDEETEKYSQIIRAEDSDIITLTNATFTWATRTEIRQAERDGVSVSTLAFQLINLNIRFPPEALTIVIGPTGSGKSTLLQALLGELTLMEGKLNFPVKQSRKDHLGDPDFKLVPTIAYCAQQAWLLNDTIRNNILFASPYNEDRYESVLNSCALRRDLEILDAGDATEVGEKGIALSGGQKQRISLARALYSPAKYVLMDDCLSAVDPHTASWIHKTAFRGPLMKARTCILVSHNVSLCLPDAAYVVIMSNGYIQAQGSPQEIVNSNLLGKENDTVRSLINQASLSASKAQSEVSSFQETASDLLAEPEHLIKPKLPSHANGKLIEDETKASGSVDWSVYRTYLLSVGGRNFWFLTFLGFVSKELVVVVETAWIRKWAQSYSDFIFALFNANYKLIPRDLSHISTIMAKKMNFFTNHLDKTMTKVAFVSGTDYYIIGYLILTLLYLLIVYFRTIFVFWGSLRASKKLFDQLLRSILGAKTRFFDITPIGRIMNRFSKDMETVDQELASMAVGLVSDMFAVVAIVLVIGFVTPGFLIAAVLITVLFVLLAALYLRTSVDLKRIESVTKSPIFQHFGETLNGVVTIRAYGDESRFMHENMKKLNINNRPFIFNWAANRWLSVRIDLLGALISVTAGAFAVYKVGVLDAGLAGLSLTYAIKFTDHVLWVVRLYSVNEMNMNSVERIKEFLSLEQEEPHQATCESAPDVWPTIGEISVENLLLRYAPNLPPVIYDVSFHVSSSSKIAIVGRTGAGKSTIATAFFRFIEAEKGRIIIDGVDISKISLKDLRNALAIIPQDPTLFKGTLRFNLDPAGVHSDAKIFEALRRVHLISPQEPLTTQLAESTNVNIFLDLSSEVAEGGNNLSQGQRQLMCMARALLKSTKVLLLDEATSSIDYYTDQKIQETIRNEFSNTTILTIAHRLRTIIDFDKVLVLSQGRIIEYDHPYALLQNHDGHFYSMVEQSGESDILYQMAKEAYQSKYN